MSFYNIFIHNQQQRGGSGNRSPFPNSRIHNNGKTIMQSNKIIMVTYKNNLTKWYPYTLENLENLIISHNVIDTQIIENGSIHPLLEKKFEYDFNDKSFDFIISMDGYILVSIDKGEFLYICNEDIVSEIPSLKAACRPDVFIRQCKRWVNSWK